jgi:hypothetical protein
MYLTNQWIRPSHLAAWSSAKEMLLFAPRVVPAEFLYTDGRRRMLEVHVVRLAAPFITIAVRRP